MSHSYRAALLEYTRERAPLDWAGTQINLGAALRALEQEAGTGWVMAKLRGIEHPAAREAMRLLQAGRRSAARKLLDCTLEVLAGPASGTELEWFRPVLEPVKREESGR